VNGYAGIDLNAEVLDADALPRLAQALRRAGTTCFVPTLITAPEPQLLRTLSVIAAARAAEPGLRRAVPFVHLEGPHIASADGPRGAHPLAAIRPPDLAEFRRWQHAAGGLVGMVTLSPHFPNAAAYIAAVRAAGVRVAIGHTDASPAAVLEAVCAGAGFSTHLGNGVAGVLPRHPNLLWTQLACDALRASFIADGFHLPADTLTCMLRAKGLARSLLISDATAFAGLPPGIYQAPIGGRVELRADGRLGVPGGPYLAGAARPLAAGVAFAANACGLTLAQALGLATEAPGAVVGGHGVLRVGVPADLLRFRWQPGDGDLALQTVLVAGCEI
jgi:N-acetylglucosamine-6-phosphate deacetylase